MSIVQKDTHTKIEKLIKSRLARLLSAFYKVERNHESIRKKKDIFFSSFESVRSNGTASRHVWLSHASYHFPCQQQQVETEKWQRLASSCCSRNSDCSTRRGRRKLGSRVRNPRPWVRALVHRYVPEPQTGTQRLSGKWMKSSEPVHRRTYARYCHRFGSLQIHLKPEPLLREWLCTAW